MYERQYEASSGGGRVPEKYPCAKKRIVSERSKEEFIRSAWIQLANEDAPIDIFEQDFGEVKEREHQILQDM